MLPFLPGYHQDMIPHGKRSYRKTHMFDVNNGIRVDCNRDVSLREQRSFPLNYQNPLAIHSVARDFEDKSDAKFAPEDTMSRLPAWVAYDRKVLRFFCSFKEDVTSSAIETWRVRHCVLYFYLEDDSIHIAEPKVENSGIPQGVFVKRHRIINDKNQYISMNDLGIGVDLAIYGRVFHIVDCDDFTRAFYASQGKELGAAEEYPIDAFTEKATRQYKKTNKKLMNPLKHFMEASLGKPMGLNVDATQQFLQYDRKVLRFYSVWEDVKMFGERRPYVVHYFLADDTVEVLEIMQPNSGRDSFPAMLKRQKLPMDYKDKAPTIPRIGLHNEPNTKYYAAKDFRVGQHIVVYGRKLMLCGCDEFTKSYYMQNFGMNAKDFPSLQMDDPVVPVPKMAPPKYNGFGTEEDSLGSFLYLMPKVPKPNFKKLMENDGINLRFLAKFVNPKNEDKGRRFIVTYYMNNDTVSIFEKFERNSGFIGGKFLERSRVKNPATKQYFQPCDFELGTNLTINNFHFELLEADDYTKNYMQQNAGLFASTAQGNENKKIFHAKPGGVIDA